MCFAQISSSADNQGSAGVGTTSLHPRPAHLHARLPTPARGCTAAEHGTCDGAGVGVGAGAVRASMVGEG